MRMRGRAAGVLCGLAGAGALLGGCSSPQQSRLDEYRRNPTPELDTLHQRHDDIDNRLTIVADTNLRGMNQDIGRVLLLDRPSRLTREPSPY